MRILFFGLPSAARSGRALPVDRTAGVDRSTRFAAGLAPLLALLVGCGGPPGPAGPDTALPGDGAPRLDENDLRTIAAPVVDGEWSAGLAIGLVQRGDVRFVGLGTTGSGDDAPPPDEDTRFEVGSVTKVLTALLFAAMVHGGEVLEDETLDEVLAGVTLPDASTAADAEGSGAMPPAVAARTLSALATHTSGLPRLPADFDPADPEDPYAGIDRAALWRSLASVAPAPEGTYLYSNLGMAVLGQALALHLGRDFGDALTQRVLAPLDLDDGSIRIAAAPGAGGDAPGDGSAGGPQAVDAQGHFEVGLPTSPWHFDAYAPAGGARASLRGLVALVKAHLHPERHGPFGDVLESVQRPRHRLPPSAGVSPEGAIALGWHVDQDGVVWHNGQTGGFHAFVGLDRARTLGVVVLANTAAPIVDELGRVLLRAAAGESVALQAPAPAEVSEATLERYVGRYRLGEDLVAEVTRAGDRLLLQATGQPKVRLWPRSDRAFVLRVTPAQGVFVLPEDRREGGPDRAEAGEVDAAEGAREPALLLQWTQAGRTIDAPRLADEPASGD